MDVQPTNLQQMRDAMYLMKSCIRDGRIPNKKLTMRCIGLKSVHRIQVGICISMHR